VKPDFGPFRHGNSWVQGAFHSHEEDRQVEFKMVHNMSHLPGGMSIAEWIQTKLINKLINGFINREPREVDPAQLREVDAVTGLTALEGLVLFGVTDEGQILGLSVNEYVMI
jgi:hypothetical protein